MTPDPAILALFDQASATEYVAVGTLVLAGILAGWSAWNKRKTTDEVAQVKSDAESRIAQAEAETKAREIITKEYRDEIVRLRDRLDKRDDKG